MSELSPEFNLELSDPAIIDPEMDNAITMAKNYQRELDFATEISEERLSEMVEHLDNAWPFHEQIVSVTGSLVAEDIQVNGDAIEIQKSDNYGSVLDPEEAAGYEDEVMSAMPAGSFRTGGTLLNSVGFMIDEEPRVIGGRNYGLRPVIRLAFNRTVGLTAPDGTGPGFTMQGFSAYPDEVYVEHHSAKARLAELTAADYFKDSLLEIRDCIGEDTTIAQDLMNVKQVMVTSPLSSRMTESELSALSSCLTEELCVKYEKMPYRICFVDKFVSFGSQNPETILGVDSDASIELAEIKSIKVRRKMTVKGKAVEEATVEVSDSEFEIRLILKLRASGQNEDPTKCEVRLSDIAGIKNVRNERPPLSMQLQRYAQIGRRIMRTMTPNWSAS